MLQDSFAAEVTPVDDLVQSLACLRGNSYDLVLVNRILDRDGSDGLEVIRQIKTTDGLGDVPVMMITNFPEHQQRAQAAGALDGFGKQALHSDQTRAKLAAVLQ
jgi:two-component system chemotaxis response regulator CheY